MSESTETKLSDLKAQINGIEEKINMIIEMLINGVSHSNADNVAKYDERYREILIDVIKHKGRREYWQGKSK